MKFKYAVYAEISGNNKKHVSDMITLYDKWI